MNNRYELKRTSQKLRCPQCCKWSYTPYIDNYTGEDVGDGCGYCDHKNSCGYHLPPREYFKDHPIPFAPHTTLLHIPDKPKLLYTLPTELVDKFHSPASTFCHWLASIAREKGIDLALARKAYEDYRLGCTANHEVIYWQIDMQGKVRSGKIMQYDAQSGHRKISLKWVHSELKKQGRLTKDFQLSQCLFGEHILAHRKTDTVCLVESEKTAVCCSVFFPEFVWVASGGCGGLNAEKLHVLENRRVIVYPDAGELDKWSKILKSSELTDYTMIDWLEKYKANTDLVDVLLMS